MDPTLRATDGAATKHSKRPHGAPTSLVQPSPVREARPMSRDRPFTSPYLLAAVLAVLLLGLQYRLWFGASKLLISAADGRTFSGEVACSVI